MWAECGSDYEKSEEGVDENTHGRIFLHQLLDSCLGADRIKECFNVTFVLCFDINMLHISLMCKVTFSTQYAQYRLRKFLPVIQKIEYMQLHCLFDSFSYILIEQPSLKPNTIRLLPITLLSDFDNTHKGWLFTAKETSAEKEADT